VNNVKSACKNPAEVSVKNLERYFTLLRLSSYGDLRNHHEQTHPIISSGPKERKLCSDKSHMFTKNARKF